MKRKTISNNTDTRNNHKIKRDKRDNSSTESEIKAKRLKAKSMKILLLIFTDR